MIRTEDDMKWLQAIDVYKRQESGLYIYNLTNDKITHLTVPDQDDSLYLIHIWWVSKRRRTRWTMCVPQEAILRSAPFIRFLLPERRLLPDIPGETRWCPCSPSWIIITMNAISFPVLTAATVLPGSASRNVGETSGQWQERGTSCARVL